MDELLDLTEKTPRAFETGPVGFVDAPLTIPIPKFELEPMLPLSAERAADGTRTRLAVPPPIPTKARRAPTMPPPIPAAALRKSAAIAAPIGDADVDVDLDDHTPLPAAVPARVDVELELAPAALPPLPAPSASWLSQTVPPPRPASAPRPITAVGIPLPRAITSAPIVDEPDNVSTAYFERPAPVTSAWTARHVAVIAVVVVAVVSVLYVAFREDSSKVATAAAAPQPAVAAVPPPREVAPAPVPVARETVPAPVEPVFASVPITSVPSGAIVTLVNDGNATVIGRTPVTASVDPKRTYDVVFAAHGHPTQIRHLGPGTHEIDVELAPVAPPPAPPVTAHVAAPATPHVATPAPRRAVQAAHVATAKPAAVAVTSSAGPIPNGILAVTTRPPCEIVVDGKPTHLVTPQRSLQLSSGRHVITLINAAQQIRKTVAIQIDVRRPTTVVQDFTKH